MISFEIVICLFIANITPFRFRYCLSLYMIKWRTKKVINGKPIWNQENVNVRFLILFPTRPLPLRLPTPYPDDATYVVRARHPNPCAALQYSCIGTPRTEWGGAHGLRGRISTLSLCSGRATHFSENLLSRLSESLGTPQWGVGNRCVCHARRALANM